MFVSVLNACLSRQLLSNLYSDLTLCTTSDKMQTAKFKMQMGKMQQFSNVEKN